MVCYQRLEEAILAVLSTLTNEEDLEMYDTVTDECVFSLQEFKVHISALAY